MNRGRKIKQMRKIINKYGVIDCEYKRPADKSFPPYRKGSYYAHFTSDVFSSVSSIGDVNQYEVYKAIVNEIKEKLKE